RHRADPLAVSPLVRAAATSYEARRPTPAARRLARALADDAAREVPWVAALTLLAFFAEAASRPPEALATRAAFEERWDALRARWRGSPDLGRALAQLPPHLEIGLRAAPGAIDAGVQLASVDLLAGVRLALDDARVREVARAALGVLGPRQRCAACGEEGYAVHLVRTRGLDDIHALACARCGALLRSFWRYGPPEGLEALAPLAVEVGAVAEIRLRLAGAAIAFQLLPGERARFTVADLERRLRELLLAPHGLAPPAGALAFRAGRARLAPDRPVPAGRGLSARLDAVGTEGAGDEAALLAALRASIARRFAG
ncbi:MAG: molecular chaperone DnaJ, partial [Anaeromyxobacteraceae bacterium]